MAINLKSEILVDLENLANQYNLDANDLLDKALKTYRRRLEENKIETEKQYFLAQHTQLKENYLGQFIAIHLGNVIDQDSNFEALHQRIRQNYGREAILIRKVEQEPDRPLLVRRPWKTIQLKESGYAFSSCC